MGFFDIFRSTQRPDTSTDGYKLFSIAKEGINQLTTNYKDLSGKGKFEVLIFNGITLLYAYQEKYPYNTEQTTDDFYVAMYDQARRYGISFTEDSFMQFVNSRVELYAREMNAMGGARDGGAGGYMPVNIYSTFYVTPLERDFEPAYNPMELMYFSKGLAAMIRWVDEKSRRV